MTAGHVKNRSSLSVQGIFSDGGDYLWLKGCFLRCLDIVIVRYASKDDVSGEWLSSERSRIATINFPTFLLFWICATDTGCNSQ